MPKRLLLINPPIHDFAAYDLFAKPHGMLHLGAYLRQAGYEIALLDCLDRNHPAMSHLPREKNKPDGSGKYYAQRLPKPEIVKDVHRYYYHYGMPGDIIRQQLQKYKASGIDAVLVTSVMTYWYLGVKEMIALIREVMPDMPVLLGGIYATLMPEHAQRVCQPDRVVNTGNMAEILRVVDETCKTQTATIPPSDFASWPAPAYDLYEKLDYLSMASSLGCTYRCHYCASGILQPKFQQADPDIFASQAIELSRYVTDQNCINFAFQDDALLVNAKNRFVPICEKLIASGLPFKMHTPNGLHCRFITPEIAKLMHRVGFESIKLSYEASDDSPEYQAASDNKVNDDFFSQAVNNLKNAGFRACQIGAYILNGLPGQSLEQMEKSAQAVHRAGVKARLCQFTPIPGTPMFNQACQMMNLNPNEPLLHDHSLMLSKSAEVTTEQFQRFKDRVGILNNQIK
ncbi:MAG: cobalamin-dependent protein [Sedimentisphaerales bacterium]|nr:cobalamin-dependent protein [Sedimentisphaerales bacterium]